MIMASWAAFLGRHHVRFAPKAVIRLGHLAGLVALRLEPDGSRTRLCADHLLTHTTKPAPKPLDGKQTGTKRADPSEP